MASYIININGESAKDMHLIGLISEMGNSNESITFEKISDDRDIFNMHPDNLTNEEAEIVASTYEREAKNENGYTIEEVREKLDA